MVDHEEGSCHGYVLKPEGGEGGREGGALYDDEEWSTSFSSHLSFPSICAARIHSGDKERRPFLSSDCQTLPEAERWRRQIIKVGREGGRKGVVGVVGGEAKEGWIGRCSSHGHRAMS